LSATQQGEALAKFAANEFPGNQLTVLVDSSKEGGPISQPLASAFVNELRKTAGIRVEEWTYQNISELTDLFKRMESSKSDVLFLAGTVDDLSAIRGVEPLERLSIIAAVPDGSNSSISRLGLKQAVYTATVFDAPQPQGKAFVDVYHARFGEQPDVHAALAYDSARFLFDGMKSATELDGVKLRDALAEIKQFDSVTGPLTFDANRQANRLVYITKTHGGAVNVTATFDPKDK
jgi:branched-chain amino acid transport system substrate-binding protein